MKTVVVLKEFLNKPLLSIHEVKKDEQSEKPILSFGIKKAKAILDSMDEIKKFVETNE